LLRDGSAGVGFFHRLCRGRRGRRRKIGGFVGLEALLVARAFLADGALGCGREDDEGVDFRGDEGGEACIGPVLENLVGCAEHPVHGGVVR
jgi:hypothetical protein